MNMQITYLLTESAWGAESPSLTAAGLLKRTMCLKMLFKAAFSGHTITAFLWQTCSPPGGTEVLMLLEKICFLQFSVHWRPSDQ